MNLNERDISRIFNSRRPAGLTQERLQSLLQSGSQITAEDLTSIDSTDLAAIRLNNDLDTWRDKLTQRIQSQLSAGSKAAWFDRIRGWIGLSDALSMQRLVPAGAFGAALLVMAVMIQVRDDLPPQMAITPLAGVDESAGVLFNGNFESLANNETIFSSNLEQAADTVLFQGGFESLEQTESAVFSGPLEIGNT